MTRYILYLSAGILAFCIGAFAVFNFYRKSENPKLAEAAIDSPVNAPNLSPKNSDWEILPLPEDFYVKMVAFGKRGEIVLLGSGILISNDDGLTWRVIKDGKGYKNCSRDGGITYSADCDGKTPAKLKPIDAFDIGSPETAVVTGDGRLYFSTTYEHTGGVWSIPLDNGRKPWYDLHFTYAVNDEQRVYGIRLDMAALGNRVIANALQPPEKQLILTTDDNGNTWRPFYKGYTREFYFIDEKIGFVLGKDLRKTVDGGKSWKKITDLPSVITEFEGEDQTDENSTCIVAMNFATEQKGYIVGSKGFLIVTNDGGKTWQKRDMGITAKLWGIKSLNEKYAWIVGEKGLILETADGGESWRKIDIGLKEDIYSNLYDNNIHIDKKRRAVWIIHEGKIYRKTLVLPDSRAAFDPSGDYHPLIRPALESEKSIHFDLEVRRKKGKLTASGEVRGVQQWYKFKSVSITSQSLKFSTMQIGGVRYDFEGNFLGKGDFSTQSFGEGSAMLEGTLRKFVNGKKTMEIDTAFLYYPGC